MMLLLVLSVLQAASLVLAPFPETHPYSFLNPVIDPWWHQLDEETQINIYALWESTEPSLFAFGIHILSLYLSQLQARKLSGFFFSQNYEFTPEAFVRLW